MTGLNCEAILKGPMKRGLEWGKTGKFEIEVTGGEP